MSIGRPFRSREVMGPPPPTNAIPSNACACERHASKSRYDVILLIFWETTAIALLLAGWTLCGRSAWAREQYAAVAAFTIATLLGAVTPIALLTAPIRTSAVIQRTAKAAARQLGMSESCAGLLLKRGIIPGMQAVPGSMWWVNPEILDSEALRETLRALSERRLVQRTHDNQTLRIPGM
jgi:hypothetical protein